MRPRQRMPWRKVRHDLWTDDTSFGLSGLALALRVLFEARAIAGDERQDAGCGEVGVGWLLSEHGAPITARVIAALARFPETEVVAALAELEAAGAVVRSIAGAWGVTGWADRQEDDSAERKRRQRDRQRALAGPERDMPVTVAPEVTPESRPREKREERDEEQEQKTDTPRAAAPPVPVSPPPRSEIIRSDTVPSEEIPALTLAPSPPARAPAARPRKPKQPQVVLLDGPEVEHAQAVLKLWHGHRVELELAKPLPEPATTEARIAEAKAASLEDWALVLRRFAEKIRRESEDTGRPAKECTSSEYFTLESLGRPKNLRRYLDLSILDVRRLPAPARASPAARFRGPDPPQNPDALPARIRE